MSNENAPAFPDSSNLDAWKKAASKSAPGGDVENLNWTTPERLDAMFASVRGTADAAALIAGLLALAAPARHGDSTILPASTAQRRASSGRQPATSSARAVAMNT